MTPVGSANVSPLPSTWTDLDLRARVNEVRAAGSKSSRPSRRGQLWLRRKLARYVNGKQASALTKGGRPTAP
jgi:hypothetical protein